MPDCTKPVIPLRELLTRGGEKERAAAVASVVEKLAETAGMSWEAVLGAHRQRTDATPQDTDWEPLPPVEGWPGYWRRCSGVVLVVRQHGKNGFYATADGLLVPIHPATPFVGSAELAMEMAEQFTENPDLSWSLGLGPALEQV